MAQSVRSSSMALAYQQQLSGTPPVLLLVASSSLSKSERCKLKKKQAANCGKLHGDHASFLQQEYQTQKCW